VVPVRAATHALGSSPAASAWASAVTWYIASIHMAVALIVIEVFMALSGMPSKSADMSPMWLIGTPTLPTSPRDRTWSGS
jgi:hypothetical protein